MSYWRDLKAGDIEDATNRFWNACRGAAGHVAERLLRDDALRDHLARVATHSRPDLRLDVVAEYELEEPWLCRQSKPFNQPIWGGVDEVLQLAVDHKPLFALAKKRITVVRPSSDCLPTDVMACALGLDAATPVPILAKLMKMFEFDITMSQLEGVVSKVTHFRRNPADIGEDYRRHTQFFYGGKEAQLHMGTLGRSGRRGELNRKWCLLSHGLDVRSYGSLPPNYLLSNWAEWPLNK